jgi:hypothetical protein
MLLPRELQLTQPCYSATPNANISKRRNSPIGPDQTTHDKPNGVKTWFGVEDWKLKKHSLLLLVIRTRACDMQTSAQLTNNEFQATREKSMP